MYLCIFFTAWPWKYSILYFIIYQCLCVCLFSAVIRDRATVSGHSCRFYTCSVFGVCNVQVAVGCSFCFSGVSLLWESFTPTPGSGSQVSRWLFLCCCCCSLVKLPPELPGCTAPCKQLTLNVPTLKTPQPLHNSEDGVALGAIFALFARLTFNGSSWLIKTFKICLQKDKLFFKVDFLQINQGWRSFWSGPALL